MDILQELYQAELVSTAPLPRQREEYRKALDAACTEQDYIKCNSSPEVAERLDTLCEINGEMLSIECEAYFIAGIRLGAMLARALDA